MSHFNWKFWAASLTLWSLYNCWYFGYQSGYSEGYEAAWRFAEKFEMVHNAGSQTENSNQLFGHLKPEQPAQSQDCFTNQNGRDRER